MAERSIDGGGLAATRRAGQEDHPLRLGQDRLEALHQPNGQADRRYVSPYNVSRVYAASRDAEPAFAWLEKAYQERNPDLIELKAEPVFDSIRSDPRFADLLHRVGWRG